MEDFENQLGTEFDPAGDLNASISDDGDVEVSVETEDQSLAESQTDDQGSDELDLDAPQFAYTDENGNEVQLTGQQIIDLIQASQVKAEEPAKDGEAQAAPEEKQEAQPEDLGFEITQIDFKKVGPDLVSMLSGENGGEEALGPAIAEFQFQTFVQDPRIPTVLDKYINKVLDAREQATKEKSSFQEFAGKDTQEADIKAFQKANPWAKSRTEAILGMQLAQTKAEIAKIQSGNTEAIKEATQKARKESEKQVIRNLKAKGTLRAIGSKPTGSTTKADNDLKTKYDISDPEQRSRAMAEHILRMRGQG